MEKTIKDLRASVRSAREQMERLQDNAEMQNEFAAAKRSYEKAMDDLKEASVVELSRKAEQKPNEKALRNAVLRTLVKENMDGKKSLVLHRSAAGGVITSATDMAAAGAVPMEIGELLNVAELPTIYDVAGVKIQTNVQGDITWPVVNSIGAVTVAGENVKVDTAAIDFSKVQTAKKRLSIAFEVSDEAINDAGFDLYGYLVAQLGTRLRYAINTAVLSVNGLGALTGPFKGTNAKRGSVNFAGDVPTYKELVSMKGAVANKGIDPIGFVYVMNPMMYATLEATPITEGDSRMILQGGKIAGYPVFQSSEVADGTVEAGCFGYVAANQHGDARIIIDPYTGSQNGTTKFVLNTDWSITTLRAEAFVIGKKN